MFMYSSGRVPGVTKTSGQKQKQGRFLGRSGFLRRDVAIKVTLIPWKVKMIARCFRCQMPLDHAFMIVQAPHAPPLDTKRMLVAIAPLAPEATTMILMVPLHCLPYPSPIASNGTPDLARFLKSTISPPWSHLLTTESTGKQRSPLCRKSAAMPNSLTSTKLNLARLVFPLRAPSLTHT